MPNLTATFARSLFAAVIILAPTSAMAQAKDHAPVALDSAEELSQDKAKSESWTYVLPGFDPAAFTKLIIEPTAIYDGPDAQFDGIESEDREKFAKILTAALTDELGEAIALTTEPGTATMRLQVTILGAEKTKSGLATASRLTPFGLATSAFKSVVDKPGKLTGSMLIAVELYDSSTGELLLAAVRRKAPDALDIPATLSTSETMKAIAHDFAKNARERLAKLVEKEAG